MFKKYRIESKTRFFAFISLMIIIIFVSLNIILRPVYVDGATESKYDTIKIKSGDTLWTIATRYADEDTDIRKFIYQIIQINDIDGSEISPGHEIIIPILN